MLNSPLSDDEKNISLMRIIYEPIPGVGGSIRHTMELYCQMDSYLNKQCIITPNLAQNSKTEKIDKRINIIRCHNKSKLLHKLKLDIIDVGLFAWHALNCAKIQALKDEYNITQVHGLALGLFCVVLSKIRHVDIPIVIMVHGRYNKKARKSHLSIHIENILLPIVCPDYYLLLDDGTDVASIIESKPKEVPYTIVYHGIDLDFYHKLKDQKSDECFRILFPHRPIAIKSPDYALYALREFLDILNAENETGQKIELVFLSEQLFEPLIRELNLDNNVLFVGSKNPIEMVDEYSKANVVIGTSLSSNMGRAIQEAMACESVIATFDSGNMSRLIKDAKDGYLIESGNISRMAQTLYTIYRMPEEKLTQMGRNARTKIDHERSWKKRISTELNIVSQLLKKSDLN